MIRLDQRLKVWETNYGQDCGWIIERNGEEIGILTGPRYEEMFWTSYKLEIVASDEDLAARMDTVEFWQFAESEEIEWRNRKFGEVAPCAFPAASPFPEPGRLTMRGLYLHLREPNVLERIILWRRDRIRMRDARVNSSAKNPHSNP